MSDQPPTSRGDLEPTAPATTTAPNLYVTVDEYADRLRVSRGTVFSWVRLGLPSFRIGRTRRIVVEKADRWLENGGADQTRRSSRSKRAPGRAKHLDEVEARQ